MTDNFFLSLATILLLPLIPAFIIYKFLPESSTDVSGPYQGLSLKLKGAFAGYFLLVIVGLALQYTVMNNKQEKKIEALTREAAQKDTAIAQLKTQVAASANPVVNWQIKGRVKPGNEATRFFYDDGVSRNDPDGGFNLVKSTLASKGNAEPPRWICLYNDKAGVKFISLNREIAHEDIDSFKIEFDDDRHQIIIKRPIEITSNVEDSIVAVANYIAKNPQLQTQVLQTDPAILDKAKVIREKRDIDKRKVLQLDPTRFGRSQ